MKQISTALVACLLLVGCGFVCDERIDGPYHLNAVDVEDQMSVSYSLPGGDSIGRISSTVFAVGKNKDFLVAKRHPNGDRTITEFYYLIRANDSAYAEPTKSVRGPFTEKEFKEAAIRLGLPSFTRTLERL